MSSDHVRLLRRPAPPSRLPPVSTPRPAARPPAADRCLHCGRSMSSDHVRLLRRPLPPKTLPPVLTTHPAAWRPGSADSRGSSLQEADLYSPRRAAPTPVMADTYAPTTDSMSMGFPWRKPHVLPKNPLLQILHTDPRFVPPPPSFCLCDFLQTRHDVGRGSWFSPGLGRTAVSRCNYRKMVNLLLQDLHRSQQTEVSRQLLTSQDLSEVSSRVPHQQLLCELAVLINMEVMALQVTMRSSLLDPEPRHQLPYQPDTQWPDLKASPSTGGEAVLNSVTAKHLQGSPHTPLAFRPITESISPSERAVLYCLKQGGKALNLKAHFVSCLPDLSPLSQTLVCLNLSFNNLSVFPEELYDLVQLAELNMKDNPLQQLPAGIQRLVRLRTLVLSSCRIRCLPADLYELPSLQSLDVSYNLLTSLSSDIGKLRTLRILNVEGNQLVALPYGALRLSLTHLRVARNFMHPHFLDTFSRRSAQTLLDLASLALWRTEPQLRYSTLPPAAQSALSRASVCDCCRGALFGVGLQLVRPDCSVFGLSQVPVMWTSCSPSCLQSFQSQTGGVTEPQHAAAAHLLQTFQNQSE